MTSDGGLSETTILLIAAIASAAVLIFVYTLHILRLRSSERRHGAKWESGHYNHAPNPAIDFQAAINEARAYREAQKDRNRRGELAEITTLLLLLLAFWIAFFQWRTLDKTDRTLRLQQRAWIAPRGMIVPENFKSFVNKYTEVVLGLENTGKEPALKTNEVLATEALAYDDFRNEPVMEKIIRKALDGRSCESISFNLKGRSIFPGGTPSIVVPFEEDKVSKINARTHYALVVGCFVYETLNEVHRTEFCGILEPPLASEKWRTTTCIIHNDAN